MTTTLADRITVDPEICHGKPTVRGSRLLVKTVLEYLAAGDSVEEVLAYHSWLTPEDVAACLCFAATLLDHQHTIKMVA